MWMAMCMTAAGMLGAGEGTLEAWLAAPALEPGQTLRELQAYVLKWIPPLEVPATAADWERERDRLRAEVLDRSIFQGVPESWRNAAPAVEWLDVIEPADTYRIRKLRYEALPGLWIPALLYEPKTLDGKVPAVFNVNGHDYELGKANPEEQSRCINLAKRGMLALHPEWLNCGELRADSYSHARQANLNACGVSGVAVFYLAMQRGLDVLLTHEHADPERVAMTGLSGGGWQTITLSALDPRIRVSVPNAGYIGLALRAEHIEDVGDLEQIPVDLESVADYTHLTALLAPRPALLLFNEKDDCCFQTHRGVPSVYDPIVPFYKLFGMEGSFQWHNNVDPGTHNYAQDNREQLYRFLNRHWLPESAWMDDEIPCESELQTPEALRCGIPENNADFVSLFQQFAKNLPADPFPAEADGQEPWRARTVERLRGLLRYHPMTASATLVREEQSATHRARQYALQMDGEWTVPVSVIEPASGEAASTVVLVADKGKAALREEVAGLIERGARVVIAEPFLFGENLPDGDRSWQYAMMIDTLGGRILGLQVAQIGAVLDWACETFGSRAVELEGHGIDAGVAVLAACALHDSRVSAVRISKGASSLKDNIAKGMGYEHHPALFCFGLLTVGDIPELTALCGAKAAMSAE